MDHFEHICEVCFVPALRHEYPRGQAGPYLPPCCPGCGCGSGDGPFVYTTDSSWTRTGRHSGRRYHWPHPDDKARAVCGYHMLDIGFGSPVSDVPERLWCKRPGCRAQYDALVRGL